jgi:hypothetical protein
MERNPKPKRMTDEQVVQFLRSVRFSDAKTRQTRQARYSINAIAREAGVYNPRIYEVIAGKTPPNARIRRAVERLVEM